jgi:hypothetical protein
MAEVSHTEAEVNARVVYWGVEGCGKSANLHAVYAKLRPDHRSEIRRVPTRFDPSVSYEVLPIELGEIAGVRTRLQIIAAPAGIEQAPTRKQLLDRVDGVVVVMDSRRECADDNLASFEELQEALGAYGRPLDRVPLVIQYNKRDLADPYALEALHRKLGVGPAPVFEAVASEGSGVLQTLSTISKRVIRSLREQGLEPDLAPAEAEEAKAVEPDAPSPAPEPEPEPEPVEPMEPALPAEPDSQPIAASAEPAESDAAPPAWQMVAGEIERPTGARLGQDFTIVSVGEATRAGDRRLRIPIVLGDSSGQTSTVALTIQLDLLTDELL